MTVYAWPSTGTFTPTGMKLRVAQNQAAEVSILSGYTQVLSRVGAKWAFDVDLPECTPDELAQLEAYFTRLNGMEHWTSFFDWMRPVPRGTINLSGVTNSGSIAQFATTATLAGCGAGATLLAGDWLKLGTQLVMNVVDATANGSGVMSIEFRHMMRAAVTTGQSVVLDHPTSNYILESSNFESLRQSGYAQVGPKVGIVEIF